jgi:hypothetical protein
MRIRSILESMNLDENKDKKVPVFRNPPILKGLESNLAEINKKDKLSKKEKILNMIIKNDSDNKYFTELKNEAKNKIRAPPNFLY